MNSSAAVMPENALPPDFDFSLPCRYFKSSFARSLSLSSASGHCKSLDYDKRRSNTNSNKNNTNNGIPVDKNKSRKSEGPPLPQRRPSRVGTATTVAAVIARNERTSGADAAQPPTIPARRPSTPAYHNQSEINANQKMNTSSLTPLRQAAYSVATATTAAAAMPSGDAAMQARPKTINQQQTHMVINANHNNSNNNSNSSSNDSDNIKKSNDANGDGNGSGIGIGIANDNDNSRRSISAWPEENVEQKCNWCKSDTFNRNTDTPHAASGAIQHFSSIVVTSTPSATPSDQHAPYQVHEPTVNVEAVILQSRVDTLQWQLEQVENSWDMYHAVMEEVARFLERFQNQRQQQQQPQQKNMEQISRSKSLYHVSTEDQEKSKISEKDPSAAYLRTRSSTNLIDLKQAAGAPDDRKHSGTMIPTVDKHNYVFKDFTWRRSPKKANECRVRAHVDDVEEKLKQEAFRLSRTINNLLKISQHQPNLVHHHSYQNRDALVPPVNLGHLGQAASTTSVLTCHGPPMLNSTNLTIGPTVSCPSPTESPTRSPTTPPAGAKQPNPLEADMVFLRAANMRDSRLSLRSSTDSSVHSTSSSAVSSISSKLETDEEPTALFHSPAALLGQKQKLQQHHHQHQGSMTEDESGFSSISSFQDVGVPVSSVMALNASTHGKHLTMDAMPRSNGVDRQDCDSRDSTLKSSIGAPHSLNNVVGLPLHAAHEVPLRWDSASKTYRNTSGTLQRFSTLSNEDPATVLWV